MIILIERLSNIPFEVRNLRDGYIYRSFSITYVLNIISIYRRLAKIRLKYLTI